MKYRTPKALLACAVAGTLASGSLVAWAQTSGAEQVRQTPAEKFLTIDLDSNGLVSEAEFVTYAMEAHGSSQADASAKFVQMAGDDGVITLSEFEAAHPARAQKRVGGGGS